MNFFVISGIGIVFIVLLTVYCCCKVSSNCSRLEEKQNKDVK